MAPASRRTSRPIGLHSACSCTHTGRSNSTRTSALVCARRQRGLVAVGWPCSSSPATILRRVALPLLAWQYASKGWPRVSGTYMCMHMCMCMCMHMYGKLRPWYVRVGWCIMREPRVSPPLPPPQRTALARLQAPTSTHLHAEDPQPHLDLPREMGWALRVAQHAALRNG